MFRISLTFAIAALIGLGNCQDGFSQMESAKRKEFVSDASFWVGTFKNPEKDFPASERAKAAKGFLSSLSEKQKAKTNLSLRAATRREWTNLPARPDADGIRIGELNQEQVLALCRLIRTVTSQGGFQKIRSIMIADDQLLRGGRPRRGFGTVDFSVVIFGSPEEKKPWSLQIDGHHMGINFSMKGEQICLTPSFIGTQPRAYKIGGMEYQPFESETNKAHRLVQSLSNEQKREAIVSQRRLRIKTGPGRDGVVPNSVGISCKGFSEAQKKNLEEVIRAWVEILPKTAAEKRMKEILGELKSMKFSWAGNTKNGSDISYTIQSPSLIIEYACQSLGGVPTEHLHSVIRNPKMEYLGQLDKK